MNLLDDPAYLDSARKARAANNAALRLAREYRMALDPKHLAPEETRLQLRDQWDEQHARANHLRQRRMLTSMALHILYCAVMPQFPASSPAEQEGLEHDILKVYWAYVDDNFQHKNNT